MGTLPVYAFIVVSLMILLLTTSLAGDEQAPVWANEPVARVATVAAPPRLDGPDPLSDPVWSQAETLGPLSLNAQPEDAGVRTDVRMLLSGDTLYVGARCFDSAPARIKAGPDADNLWRGDSLEFLFTQGPAKGFPLLLVQVGADGKRNVLTYLLPSGPHGDPLIERPDPSLMAVRSEIDAKGWWMVMGIPLGKYGLAAPPGFANVMRVRAEDKPRHSWVDLFNNRFLQPSRMGQLVATAPPMKPLPRVRLPATLAIGSNALALDGWQPGGSLCLDGKPVVVDASGKAVVVVERPGTARLDLVAPDGSASGGWSADVRRPLIVSAANPFSNDPAGPLSVQVTLSVTAPGTRVTIEALQDGKSVGRKEFDLASGTHSLEIPLAGTKAGEVRIVAKADVSLPGGRSTSLSALHWCVLGEDAQKYDRFRPGIEKLGVQPLYRAAVADAMTYLRLIQSGDGSLRHPVGRGEYGFVEFDQCAVYALAVLYKADWPENPHHGDPRLLDSVSLALDAELDPKKWQAMRDLPPNRDLEAALLAYDLIKSDVPPERRESWRRGFEAVVQSVVDVWMTPMGYRFSHYSIDVGSGTNHYAFFAFSVWLAGKTLDRPDWETLGRDAMRRLAAHEHDGQFPERRDLPATHYTWHTLHNVTLYYFMSGDETVKEHVLRGGEFNRHNCVPNGERLSVFDGRNNEHGVAWGSDIALSLTPTGRELARVRALTRFGSDKTPSQLLAEGWLYWAANAMYFRQSDVQEMPETTEFPLLDGRGVIARKGGFTCGLAAICLRPIAEPFRLDPQNAIELYHAKAGWLLHGCNSQRQPEAGSFFQQMKDRVVFLPVEGNIQRTATGHAARLKFETFESQVLTRVVSENRFEVRAELLQKTDDAPVVYNFFPGVAYDRSRGVVEDLTLSEDKRTIRFRNVTIECSRPVEVERNFLIYNPYSGKRAIRTKPVRAWCELEVGKPLVMTITVAR